MVEAIFFDRDDTLIVDVPYNGDPERVVLCPYAREAVAKLRQAGRALAMVSNQSGVGRGLITLEQMHAVNARVEALLGPLGPWFICPHAPDECDCRKPSPRLVLDAATSLGIAPARCVLIGDKPSDAQAARAAGARSILVTAKPCAEADAIVPDLLAAADLALSW